MCRRNFFALQLKWTFEGVNVVNYASYTNIQMYLAHAAGDFDVWYLNNGYYQRELDCGRGSGDGSNGNGGTAGAPSSANGDTPNGGDSGNGAAQPTAGGGAAATSDADAAVWELSGAGVALLVLSMLALLALAVGLTLFVMHRRNKRAMQVKESTFFNIQRMEILLIRFFLCL